ncbi:N-acetyltransferase [Nodosilinea sp. LEGE 06152]|uniref:GNAT family N-acetyltransferase n=1 Tax=Nodosilinea sp. LEGE 06152 TaxID=2777966 RepID=UPI001881532D|nr:GNAT family N-acetyltransferase [Nodosilinea sp. LEGE 06152]MBE9155985.1 N-acetyltransferase [Nodosilinea sp. LEGE 06152]
MRYIHCTYDMHAPAILNILNEAIVNSTALYDYQPRTLESMVSWFKTKDAGSYPVIGVHDDSNQLLGFASYGAFRSWPAYKYTIEHSVYIHKEHRGKGLGMALMQRLIEEARSQQYHVIVGGIDATNLASISLHEKLGFSHAGTIKHVGFKFNRWLDLAFYQLVIDTPAEPVDG